MQRGYGILGALLLLAAGTSSVLAQDSTPMTGGGATFADTLGLPELSITVTDNSIEGVPAETAAGRYLLNVTVEAEEFGGAEFVLLAEGMTGDPSEFIIPEGPPPGDMEGMDMGSPAAGAEMEGMDMGSPAAGGEEQPGAWLYQTYISGGAGGPTGGTYQSIIDLPPGDYVAWDEDTTEPAVAPMTVTGEMPSDLPEPEAAVTVREVATDEGFAFEVEGELAVGPQVIEIVNESDQPHFLDITYYPEPVTIDQLFAAFSFDPEAGGTPPPGMLDFSQAGSTGFAATQSAGTTQWIPVNVEAGSHILLCFIPDPARGGTPHAFEGMVEIVVVE